jgi:hypothetical protein
MECKNRGDGKKCQKLFLTQVKKAPEQIVLIAGSQCAVTKVPLQGRRAVFCQYYINLP